MAQSSIFQKTLLVVPPFYRLMGGRNEWIHLGLSYVGAVLNRNGHEVKIYNTDHSSEDEDIDLRGAFDAYDSYRKIANNPHHPMWQEILEGIEQYSPDLLGISIVFSATLKSVENIARMVKQHNRLMKIVVGGPHATLAPDETLKSEFFDYLVRGEGEYTLLELVEGRDPADINGLSYKDDQGRIRHNPDRRFIDNLDELPPPDPHLQLIPLGDLNENFGVIATSRGCPKRCVFCSSPRLWSRKVRRRSISNVIAEMSQRYHECGVRKFYFSDDSFNLNKNYAKELCRAIVANNLKIEFYCEANIGSFDRELMELMKEAGCIRLKLGMEAGTDRILKLMRKGITVSQIRETCSLAKEAGVDYTLYVMVGMPSETLEEMHQTLELSRELDAKYVSLSVATPQIGTELSDMAVAQGIKIPPESCWESFYHQSTSTVLNSNVNAALIDEFLALNGEGKKPPYRLALKD